MTEGKTHSHQSAFFMLEILAFLLYALQESINDLMIFLYILFMPKKLCCLGGTTDP